jgi:hypothetical protein
MAETLGCRAGRGEMAPVSPWTWISGDGRMDGWMGCWDWSGAVLVVRRG